MKQLKNSNIYIPLFIIVLIDLLLKYSLYGQVNFFPMSWDSQHITFQYIEVMRGSISISNIDYYSSTTMLLVIISKIFNFTSIKIVPYFSLLLSPLIPIFVYLCINTIFNEKKLGIFGAFVSIFSNIFLRNFIFQKLYSIIGIIIILAIILFFFKERNKKNTLILIILIFMLVLFHQLSFLIIFLSLLFYYLFKTKPSKKLIYLLIFFICGMFIFQTFYIGKIINPLKYALIILFQGNTIEMSDLSLARPFLEIPSFLGYTIFILGVIGLIYYIKNKKQHYFFLSLFFSIPILIANGKYIGFNFAPHRFLEYSSLPLIIMAPYAIKELIKNLNIKKYRLFYVMLIFSIILGVSVNGICFVKDEYTSFASRTVPSQDDIDAYCWIKNNSTSEQIILTVNTWPFLQAIYGIPLYADRKVITLDTQSKVLEEPPYHILETRLLIGKIITPLLQNFPDIFRMYKKILETSHNRQYEVYYIFTHPDEKLTEEILERNKIKYIITYVKDLSDIRMKKSNTFIVVYSKGGVNIWEKR